MGLRRYIRNRVKKHLLSSGVIFFVCSYYLAIDKTIEFIQGKKVV